MRKGSLKSRNRSCEQSLPAKYIYQTNNKKLHGDNLDIITSCGLIFSQGVKTEIAIDIFMRVMKFIGKAKILLYGGHFTQDGRNGT